MSDVTQSFSLAVEKSIWEYPIDLVMKLIPNQKLRSPLSNLLSFLECKAHNWNIYVQLEYICTTVLLLFRVSCRLLVGRWLDR
jgi:hypothetical protein